MATSRAAIIDLSDASTVVNYNIKENGNVSRKSCKPKDEDRDNSCHILRSLNVENMDASLVADTDVTESSTIVKNTNMNNNSKKNMRPRKEEKCEFGNNDLFRFNKVAEWLKKNQYFGEYQTLGNTKELEEGAVSWWLDRDAPSLPEVVCVRGFVVTVQPNIDDNPLDFVSGYCHSGCKGVSVFSKVGWRDLLPICPLCADGDKYVQLMFVMKLHIMDTKGNHCRNVYLCKEEAECFFRCSVMDFVTNEVIRENRLKCLRSGFLLNSLQQQRTPLLDLALVNVRQSFFIVNISVVDTRQVAPDLDPQ